MARDEDAASTLDAAMQMEQLRASYIANQAKGEELSLLEAAVVTFRTEVGRRLCTLDLCPTASPSGVLSGYLRGLSRQAVSWAQDTVKLQACWRMNSNSTSAGSFSVEKRLQQAAVHLNGAASVRYETAEGDDVHLHRE